MIKLIEAILAMYPDSNLESEASRTVIAGRIFDMINSQYNYSLKKEPVYAKSDPTINSTALVRLTYPELYELGMTLDSELGKFFGNLSKDLKKSVESNIEKEREQRENPTCEVGVNCD